MKHILLAFLMLFVVARGETAFTPTKTPVSPEGAVAIIDLPGAQHMRNTGGSDGYGLCVNTSIEVAGRWQNIPQVVGLQEWSTHRPGGSTSSQVPGDLRAFAKAKNVTLPPYVQHTGGDDAFLELIYKTRRMPCMTYAGADDFYSGTIAHMVNGAYLDGLHGAIIDNNRPGEWVWSTRKQHLNRWKGLDDNGEPLRVRLGRGGIGRSVPVGGGWVFCWLTPPPPPKEGQAARPAPLPVPRAVRWDKQTFANGRVVWFCWEKERLLGVLDAAGWHRALSNDSWEEQVSAPPANIRKPVDSPDFPSEPGPLAPCPGPNCPYRYWVNGIETTREAAFAAVIQTALVDDSDKYSLSIVVGDDARAGADKTVQGWFAGGGKLERFAGKVHVNVYARSHWVVKDRLPAAITIHEPAKKGGKIVYRGDGGELGPSDMEAILADLFDPKPEPAPEPEPVPEPEPEPQPVPAPAPSPAPVPVPAPVPSPDTPVEPEKKSWLSLIVAFLVALFWRKQ